MFDRHAATNWRSLAISFELAAAGLACCSLLSIIRSESVPLPSLPVRIAMPPGDRACGGRGGNDWVWARDAAGGIPIMGDITSLHDRFPSAESKATYMEIVRDHIAQAVDGALPWDLVTRMQIAPDVLEIRLPKWWFSGGPMIGRLYFSEPVAYPGKLVALRLKAKRPGPIGLDEQDEIALQASDLLSEFEARGFQ
jgi:hypothetical protein